MSKSNYTGLMLCGDFNCPKIKWNSGLFSSCPFDEGSFESLLIESLDDCFYYQNVHNATFQESKNNSKNILDLVITECYERIYNIFHGPPLDSTVKGHHSLTWNYELRNFTKNKEFNSKPFNYCGGNYESFSRFFSEINWSQVLSNLTVDQMYNKFKFYYDLALKMFVPRRSNSKKHKPWINKHMKKLLSEKFSAWRAFMVSGWSIEKEVIYNKIRKKCQAELKAAVINYESIR